MKVVSYKLPTSPTLFKIFLEQALKSWKLNCGGMGIPNQSEHIFTLIFAYDQVVLVQDKDDLTYMERQLEDENSKNGLEINTAETEYLELENGTRKKATGKLKFCDSQSEITPELKKRSTLDDFFSKCRCFVPNKYIINFFRIFREYSHEKSKNRVQIRVKRVKIR